MNNIEQSIKDTLDHKAKVEKYIDKVGIELATRALSHDNSKLKDPELRIFAEYGPKLKNTIYGSDVYKAYLKEMKVALDHHYRNNFHHPEHHEKGIKGMDLVDLLEMICDWKASSERHSNGDILKSVEINQERFKYSDDLKAIFKNTVERYLK